jgi:hypothetical protein
MPWGDSAAGAAGGEAAGGRGEAGGVPWGGSGDRA